MKEENIEEKVTIICLFCCSIFGLFLIYMFEPTSEYLKKNPEELSQECTGKIKISGKIEDSYVSKNGNYVAKLASNLFVVSEKPIFNEEITVYGRASFYKGNCWIFSDKYESN